MQHLLSRGVVVATLSLLLSGAASALTFPPTITFDVVGGADPTKVNSLGSGSTSGDVTTWTLSAPQSIEGVTINSWSAALKEDPFVTNNINVTNTTGVTQTFIATVILPIPTYNYNTVINSSFGVTVTDSNGNGVLNLGQSGGTAIYQGTVNGSAVLSMNPLTNPVTLAACTPFPFSGCTATSSNGVASLGVTPGSATQIGIILTFTLSPGDSAGLTSRFEIIPEPGQLLLGSLGLVGLWLARRRQIH